MNKTIEIIARVIIKNNNKVLLCKNRERGYYYLPGGHIEFSENIINGLKREIKEEINCSLKIIKFLGILENFFKEKNFSHHEINIIFEGKIKNKKVKSKESYIEFEWIDIKNLDKIKILPKSIKKFIEKKKTNFLIEYD